MDLFHQNQVITGAAERQTVLTGFLLGGAVAELAVVNVDGNGLRRLRLHSFEGGTWAPRLDAALGPAVTFVDVAEIGGRDRLISYEPGRLNWFDPESATERPLVPVTSSFEPPGRSGVLHVDVTHDVNADGRDDLVVPGADGFRVYIQTSDGAFADPVVIGPSTALAGIYGGDGYRYDPWGESRVHAIDYDGDGRRDLVFWNDGRFHVHRQNARGRFAPVPAAFTTGVAFDSDDIPSLAGGDAARRALHSLADLNGDGVADMLVLAFRGRTTSSLRSASEIHFGRLTSEGTVFAPDVGAAIETEDSIQIAIERHDYDRDGQVDLMFTTIGVRFLEGTLYNRFRGFMGGEIHLDLEFYRMPGGLHAGAPNATSRINLQYPGAHRGPGWVPLEIALRGASHASGDTRETYRRAFGTPLLVGDVTGDRLLDLLVGWGREQLPGLRRQPSDLFRIYEGIPGPELFARQPRDVAVDLLDDGEYVWLADLNRDGKQDIVLHYPSTSGPHRVTMLIAR